MKVQRVLYQIDMVRPFCVMVVRAKAGCFRVRISFNVIQNQPDRPKLGRNISKMMILLHTYTSHQQSQ